MSDIKSTAKHYDERAKVGDSIEAAGQWYPREVATQICDEICNKINLRYEDRVLEVGCGSGVLGAWIKDRCSFYVGIDLSSNMMNLFTNDSKSSPPNLILSSAEKLPIISNLFTVVILNSVSMYFPSDNYFEKVLMEMKSVTTQKGRIFLGENVISSRLYYEYTWFGNLSPLKKRIAKPYIRMRIWIAQKFPRFAGKWKNVYYCISLDTIRKCFSTKTDINMSDAAGYSIRKRIYGNDAKGNHRIDVLINL